MPTLYDPVDFSLQDFTNRITLSTDLWERFDISVLGIDYTQWDTVKMMNAAGDLHEDFARIPDYYGGIYVYTIRPPVIPDCGDYVMYIGMASKTDGENLRQRVRSYKKEFGPRFKREKLHRLFTQWGKYVYVRFLPVDATENDILILEDRLIAAFVPQCNSQIRIKSVKQAVNAFR